MRHRRAKQLSPDAVAGLPGCFYGVARMSLPPPALFSVIIPARDEEGSVGTTVRDIHEKLH